MAEIQSELNPEPCTQLEKLNQIVSQSSYVVLLVAHILQLLHNYFPWETIEDIDVAERGYYRVLWEQRNPKIDDITADLAKLKELSSILRGHYDSGQEVCFANQKASAQPYYDLVEQLPNIKKDPSYKDLTTGWERYMIQQVLKQRYHNGDGQIQTPQQSLSSHLEVKLCKILVT
ncbi:hypothetical protein MKW98_027381 [Papaver atlanticum]|uniref:Uncharacterized protein n=1 Tax=Papaver atlanticum TaxID=357466 RepID=A0AAD4TGR0_9MAGN|nr:hypothetical protein MKW98_027381 [Papaver atlanticum]